MMLFFGVLLDCECSPFVTSIDMVIWLIAHHLLQQNILPAPKIYGFEFPFGMQFSFAYFQVDIIGNNDGTPNEVILAGGKLILLRFESEPRHVTNKKYGNKGNRNV
jgi:hypothetical protein